jgi:hypothetical protein
MPQAIPIIPCEVQTGEAQRCNKILREKNVRLKMWNHRVSLNKRIENLNLDKELYWNQQV